MENNSQKGLFLFILLIFSISLSIEYAKFLDLTDEEIYESRAVVLNIYKKDGYDILKLKDKNFDFFTSVANDIKIQKLDTLQIAIITKRLAFTEYLKGFYTKNIYFDKLKKNENNLKYILREEIDKQHKNNQIKEFYQALFLAIPISKDLREICTKYGISHLIALSGFHLAVLSFLLYWVFHIPYSFFHKRYFPYRNKKYDLLLFSMCFLFSYLIFVDTVPSLLRAFVMFVFGIFLLRSNIKLLSFKTLLYTFLLIIAFFPKLLFSIGFWFSISAVFYIFLYLQYFSKLNKYFNLLFFNFWIFLSMNSIVHYYFYTTSYEQLLSPVLTIVFTLFYPFELFSHIFGFGGILDEKLIYFFSNNIDSFEKSTPLWFLLLYIVISFLSISKKWAFYILNALMIGFNIYMFLYF